MRQNKSALICSVMTLLLAAVMLRVSPASGQGDLTGNISGRLFFRGQPQPNLEIRIKLLQSFADLQPFALASQTVIAMGRGNVFTYTLDFDPALIDPDGVYYIDALGLLNNRIVWVTQGDTYVLTQGYPTTRQNATLIPLKQLPPPAETSGASIMQVVDQDPVLGTLSGLLKDSGLATELSSGTTQTTLFAPSNEAFAKLPAGT